MRELLSRTLSEGGEPRWNLGRRMALYRHPKSGTPVRSRDYAELLYMVRGSSRHRIGTTDVELAVGELLLRQAAWLLEHTRQRISDSALSVGYENVSYFHRIFQKRFGLSPKKYRDNQ